MRPVPDPDAAVAGHGAVNSPEVIVRPLLAVRDLEPGVSGVGRVTNSSTFLVVPSLPLVSMPWRTMSRDSGIRS